MIELIAIVLLGMQIYKLAERKGEKQWPWVWRMVLGWIGFELLGLMLAMGLLGIKNWTNLLLIGVLSGLGGYLLTKYQLDKMPDAHNDIGE